MTEMLLLDKRTQMMVEDYTPNDKILTRLGSFFSLFSDATRLKLISALCVSDMCVTDLSRVLKLNQTTVSHQLKLLRDASIVETHRQGKIIFYSVDSEQIDKIMLCATEFLRL